MAAGLVACGSDDSGSATASTTASGGESRTIVVSMYGREIPFFNSLERGVRAEVDERGWKATFLFSPFDPGKQFDDVQNAVTQQPDGIIVSPLDAAGLVPAAKAAGEAGIPVITLADELADPSAAVSYVGGDFAEYGRLKAEAIAKQLGEKGTVAIVNGTRGLAFVELQAKAAREVFAKYPDIEIVKDEYTKQTGAADGLAATQNILAKSSDVQAIFYSGDDLALGGIQAIKEREIPAGKIFVAGTDAEAAGIAALKEGYLSYTIAQCAFQQGVEAVDTLGKAIDGETVEPRVISPAIELYAKTVDEQLAEPFFKDCTGN